VNLYGARDALSLTAAFEIVPRHVNARRFWSARRRKP
jgi:hypothetical protein